MTKHEMTSIVRAQLAIDLNCSQDDFDKGGFVFCEAKENPKRRPFPRGTRHFEMLTMGGSMIVSATNDILPFLEQQLCGKTRDEAFCMPFVHGCGLYFLPGELNLMATPEGFRFELVEQADIERLYANEGFVHAIQYDINHPRPDALAIKVSENDKVIAIAGSSNDCENLWQIGIDVLPEFRGHGLAAALTNHLAIEILKRGKIPYYGTSACNIASQNVAHRAGFKVAWACVYRGLFDKELTAPTG